MILVQGNPNSAQNLRMYLAKNPAFTHIVGFRPTGWTHKPTTSLNLLTPKTAGRVTIYGDHPHENVALLGIGVPYSEHSSFTELRRFALCS